VLPIGQLVGGAVAEEIGPRWTVCLGGVICLAAAAAFRQPVGAIREAMKPGKEVV
jgi:hypothetical protein